MPLLSGRLSQPWLQAVSTMSSPQVRMHACLPASTGDACTRGFQEGQEIAHQVSWYDKNWAFLQIHVLSPKLHTKWCACVIECLFGIATTNSSGLCGPRACEIRSECSMIVHESIMLSDKILFCFYIYYLSVFQSIVDKSVQIRMTAFFH